MELSEILKELRVEANLTQKELANKLKIGQSTIVGYEKGEREATLTNLSRYADFFGVSLDYLAGREDDFGARVSAGTVAPMEKTPNAKERELLADYRQLTPNCQKLVQDTIKTLLASSSTAKSENKNIS